MAFSSSPETIIPNKSGTMSLKALEGGKIVIVKRKVIAIGTAEAVNNDFIIVSLIWSDAPGARGIFFLLSLGNSKEIQNNIFFS